MPPSDTCLSVRNVSKRFGMEKARSPQILSDFSLTVDRGEIVCVIGRSGCGKTTLLRIIAGLETGDTGDVDAFGRNGTAKISYMPQSDSLLPWRSVESNVALGLEIAPQQIGHRERSPKEMLAIVGLRDHGDKKPAELSGGMKRRAALARTLVVDADVFLFDEPLTHLDEVSRHDLACIIRNEATARGIGALVVTHALDEALALSDRILVLAGRPARIAEVIVVPESMRGGVWSLLDDGSNRHDLQQRIIACLRDAA